MPDGAPAPFTLRAGRALRRCSSACRMSAARSPGSCASACRTARWPARTATGIWSAVYAPDCRGARRQPAGAAFLALRHRPEPPARRHRDVRRRQQHRAVPDALLRRHAALPRRQASPTRWSARAASSSTGSPTTRPSNASWRACVRCTAVALLWDGHSIESELPWLFEGRLPELNLGSNAAQSCSPAARAAVAAVLAAQRSYSQVVDGRFKGGYITRHYGRPAEGWQALQMEMVQAIYMLEDRQHPPPRPLQPAKTRAAATAAAGLPAGLPGRRMILPPTLARARCPLRGLDGLEPNGASRHANPTLDPRRLAGQGRWQERCPARNRQCRPLVRRIDARRACSRPTPGVLPGAVLPPLVDAHSHAFQRAMAGLAERFASPRTRTISGAGVRRCTAWHCASRPAELRHAWPRGFTASCLRRRLHAGGGVPLPAPRARTDAAL
jgi:hypothetical protein